MSFAEALQRQTRLQRGPRCSVGKLLARLNPDDAAELTATLAERGDYKWREISAAIEETTRPAGGDPGTGLSIPHQTLSRHARGECACRDVR